MSSLAAAFFLCLFACSKTENEKRPVQISTSTVAVNSSDCDISIDDLIEKVLGKPVNSLPNVNRCYISRDTLMEYEGEAWKAKVFTKNDTLGRVDIQQ